MNALNKYLTFLIAAEMLISPLIAEEKRILKSNMTLIYKSSNKASTLSEIFTKGIYYGRFRVNSFIWDWKKKYFDKTKDNWALGVGGSLIFKSAYLHGIGFTIGFYTSQNPWHMDKDEVIYVKSGKDTFSRYKVKNGGGFGITSLAQSYLEYKNKKTAFKIGRQIFESLLTKSNDTKMIPNTFEGVSLISRYVSHTTFKIAYLTKQKLRDHIKFHDVITFKDKNGDGWANNDDAAVHKGLTYQKLEKNGKKTDNSLIIFEILNNSIDNLKIMINYTGIPYLFHILTGEAHYKMCFKNDMGIIPGLRYLVQFDDGAGKIGGANLKADSLGYKDPNSLDSFLLAARVDIKKGPWMIRVGYSKVADKGDIVTPWRGFPTGGFTRAMGQYNWYAGTKTYMLKGVYDFGKAGISDGLKVSLRYALEDFDDKKPGVQADSRVLNFDVFKKFKSFPGLYAKIRMGIVKGDGNTKDMRGNLKRDPSYQEYRFELNYLF